MTFPVCAHPYCSEPADKDDFPYCVPHRFGVSREFDVPASDDDDEAMPLLDRGSVTTACRGPVIQTLEASMRYLTAALVAALTLALTPVAAGHSLTTGEKKQQLRRYYKANGVVRWIGAHARTTEYHPDPLVKRRWKDAARFWVQVREDAWRELHPAPPVRSVPQIICAVFGPNCSKALSVAACESHFYVGATNGIYFGVFQMGSGERARFGGSSLDPWDQVRAAYRYFSIAGWGPWECA